MSKLRLTAVAMSALLALTGANGALAQDSDAQSARAKARDMTPEQREAARGKANEKWDSMSDDEKAGAREKRDRKRDMQRAKWESLSDEQKAQLREKRASMNKKQWESMSGEERQRMMERASERADPSDTVPE